MIPNRTVEFGNEFGKEHVTATVTLVNGVDEKAGGQTRFAATGDAQPEDILLLVHVDQAVVEGHDFLLAEIGLPLEGIRFDGQGIRDLGAFEAQPAGVLAFEAAFFLQDVGKQTGMGEVGVGGLLEIFIPMSCQSAQVQKLQGLDQLRVHDGLGGGSW